MGADTVLMHERVLVERARSGNRLAFEEIYGRTAPAVWRVAVAVAREPDRAAAAVEAAYARVLNQPPPGAAPLAAPVSVQLARAVRNAALDHSTAGSSPTGPAALGGSTTALQAFHDLPERRRSALWLRDVEGLEPPAAAAALGMTPDAVDELVERARAGLREQYATRQLHGIGDAGCRRAAEHLEGYASEELSIREANRVRRHLDACEACRDRLAALDDVLPELRRSVAALPEALRTGAERAWREATHATAGPLHLRLPGGTHVPAWAEKALAGAAAAVVTLGITGAIIAGGRGSKVADDHLARQAAASDAALGSGESALGPLGDLSLTLPDGSPVPTVGGGASGSSSGDGATSTTEPVREQARSGSTALSPPSSSGGTTTTAPPRAPAPAPTAPSVPAAPAPPPPPTTPSSPPTTAPLLDTVTDAVDDTVDGTCDAVELLDPVLCGGATDPLGGLGL